MSATTFLELSVALFTCLRPERVADVLHPTARSTVHRNNRNCFFIHPSPIRPPTFSLPQFLLYRSYSCYLTTSTTNKSSSGHNTEQIPDLGILRESFWLDILGKDTTIYFTRSQTVWRAGPILTERVLHGDVVDSKEISEASGVCIATQIQGPSVGMEAILKIRMQSVCLVIIINKTD